MSKRKKKKSKKNLFHFSYFLLVRCVTDFVGKTKSAVNNHICAHNFQTINNLASTFESIILGNNDYGLRLKNIHRNEN